jgi:hypothetical protein
MRAGTFLALSVFVAAGCARQPEAPPAPVAQIHGNLNQVMRGILFPNSNVIFDAQDKDPGAPPDPSETAGNPYAGVYGGWEGYGNAAIALYEAANLVQLPGRSCQNGKPVPSGEDTFVKGLAALRETSLHAYRTAEAKNKDAIPDVAEKLAAACATCHDVYRDRVIDGKPMTMEQRCGA